MLVPGWGWRVQNPFDMSGMCDCPGSFSCRGQNRGAAWHLAPL